MSYLHQVYRWSSTTLPFLPSPAPPAPPPLLLPPHPLPIPTLETSRAIHIIAPPVLLRPHPTPGALLRDQLHGLLGRRRVRVPGVVLLARDTRVPGDAVAETREFTAGTAFDAAAAGEDGRAIVDGAGGAARGGAEAVGGMEAGAVGAGVCCEAGIGG